MTPKAHVRRDEILRLAETSGLASVEELSARFDVTASTIRRDLARLTAKGKLARTYGGAISLNRTPESSLRDRLDEASVAKRAIARWAAAQIQPGQVIAVDAGSTNAALAEQIRVRLHAGEDLSGLTVVTSGLLVMQALGDQRGIEVIALGGRFRPISQAFVGPLAEATVGRLSFDLAFIGADSVHAERGICEAELEQTRLKELVMGRAQRTMVLAHSAKLGRSPYHAWASMPASWTLVTDSEADQEQIEAFRARGVEVRVAEGVAQRAGGG